MALVAIASAHALVWDAAADFGLSSNPNGVWSYGWWDNGMQNSTSTATGTPFDWWMTPNGYPTVGKNGQNYTAFGIQPGHLSLECDFSTPVLRFTVPTTGQYQINLTVGGTTEWINGGFGNNWVAYSFLYVNGYLIPETSFVGNVKTWTIGSVNLAGDTIDARMSNHYGGGNTDTMMTVTLVPEPGSILSLTGLALVAAMRRRRGN